LLSRAAYRELLKLARRHAGNLPDAEDLLHDALAAALAARRGLGTESRAWLSGTMRNLAAMTVRTSVRRRRREACVQAPGPTPEEPVDGAMPAMDGLAPSLRIVALLALSGHNRAEIRHLLRISDDALRQRVSGIRRLLAAQGEVSPADFLGLRESLAFGSIRRALLPMVRNNRSDFASHDPDGHPIAFRIRVARPHETRADGNT
jgi:RNA polymerase sigma-70 factor, ECF subfamily